MGRRVRGEIGSLFSGSEEWERDGEISRAHLGNWKDKWGIPLVSRGRGMGKEGRLCPSVDMKVAERVRESLGM